ncbi:alpha/beta fold hydrolase [Thalassococcus sp. CAU 1522]|uniref:Alpha/beta fold hydrolase n=1 Tax=Thalassococcus arenae TaxID=2851652 RepID=A0ABS6N7U6_9RHOB|nr:alpha/beta fold hydrolase [Thalassococcus arenae]MBV2360098.1 alpha/beta fold hydrolase [Thalassococcus arenae]
MADVLLIHGSGHGAWCWRDVVPVLTRLGHHARAIDLPSHGADRTPVNDVTLDGYTQAILEAMDGPTVLVGHSMAGYPISTAAEAAPDLVTRLIYVCAYTPWPGLSLADMRKLAPRQPLLEAVIRSEDGKSFTIDPAKARRLFYHDCPDEAVAHALANLCPQAIAPQATPVTLGAGYSRVPRSYILCEDDRTIPPEFQQDMAARFDPRDVHRLPVSHSPFFAMPDRLARLIHDLI